VRGRFAEKTSDLTLELKGCEEVAYPMFQKPQRTKEEKTCTGLYLGVLGVLGVD
jgi:hypothetical protein